MQRVTLSLDDEIVAMLDDYMRRRGATNRSEAVRDIVRQVATRQRVAHGPEEHGIGTFSYIYDLEKRETFQRLARTQHQRHDMVVTKMNIPLDHDASLEVAILRGKISEMQLMADIISNQRGIRHGNLHVLPVDVEVHQHDEGMPHTHYHTHGG